MRTLKVNKVTSIKNSLEGIVRTARNERGNMALAVGFGLGLMLTLVLCTATRVSPVIQDVQPYANGSTVQGVVLAEKLTSAQGSTYTGTSGVRNDLYQVLVRTPDGRCYGFSTAAASAPDGTGSVVSELEKKVEVGSEVAVNNFNPAYRGSAAVKGTSDCGGFWYGEPVAPSQIEAKQPAE